MRNMAGLLVCVLAAAAWAGIDAQRARDLYEKVTPSLVVVQYTYDGEVGRRELAGAGVVLSDDGLVMTTIALFPAQIANSQMKEFKIIIPGDEEKEIPAVFLGRDERSDLAFVKAADKAAHAWVPLPFEQTKLQVGQTVCSVGLLPKEAGYRSYYAEAFVSAILRGPVQHILVSPDGVAGVGSPVFDEKGRAVGFVMGQQGRGVLLSETRTPLDRVNEPPRFFIPTQEFAISLLKPPTEKEPVRVAWLGAVLTGIKKEVAEYFDLKGTNVAQVGDVVADSPAGRAGLKTGDKIVAMDGKPLERGDDPEEVAQILLRKLRRIEPGKTVVLSVLREKDKPPLELKVKLEPQPRQPYEADRFYAEDIGMTVREMVFADIYAKRLPPETTGVVVSFLRPSSAAQTARLQPGDLITSLNNQPVTSLKQYETAFQEFRKANPAEAIVVVVTREGATQVIRIQPPQ